MAKGNFVLAVVAGVYLYLILSVLAIVSESVAFFLFWSPLIAGLVAGFIAGGSARRGAIAGIVAGILSTTLLMLYILSIYHPFIHHYQIYYHIYYFSIRIRGNRRSDWRLHLTYPS